MKLTMRKKLTKSMFVTLILKNTAGLAKVLLVLSHWSNIHFLSVYKISLGPTPPAPSLLPSTPAISASAPTASHPLQETDCIAYPALFFC